MKSKFILSSLMLSFFCGAFMMLHAQKADDSSWNQFRGQTRSGIVENTVIPNQLPAKGAKLVWKKQIGEGFAEVTAERNRIYTMISEKIDSLHGDEFLAAFEAETGNEIWRVKVDSIYIDADGWGDGTASTPAIGKELVFTFSRYGKLTASDKITGKQVWQKDFVKEFGSTSPRWGYASSPMLVDDMVIMEAGGTDSRAFVAIKQKTGKLVWAKGKGNASHTSPVLADIERKTNILFANGRTLYSFDTKGDTLWTYTMPMGGTTAVPVVFDGNKIFVSANRRTGFCIVEVKNGKVHELRKGNTMKNDFNSSVYYDGHIYGFHIATLQCISVETGEKKWSKRGYGKGSLILVDGKLLVLSDKGKVIQVKASPEAYTEQGKFQAIKGKSWTAPSFANGKLYVRNLTEMACFQIK